MKVSHAWLQRYFSDPLPSAEDLVEVLTFHSFEIEGVEKIGSDTVLDVDVLPNRSSDCLSHRGIAKELSVLLNIQMKRDPLMEKPPVLEPSNLLKVSVEDTNLVPRFSVALMRGVEVSPSPQWLKESLVSLGQRPINNIVDAANYVMFDLGQPLHIFDADKLKKENGEWGIATRYAKEGESVRMLSGVEYSVTKETLLITDMHSGAPLSIAGIKGGKEAEVSDKTKDIIIESATFNPLSIRKTSRRLKLRTDASARFENEPPQEFTVYALNAVIGLILEIAGGESGGVVDKWHEERGKVEISVTVDEINNLLGADVKGSEVEDIFNRFGFSHTRRRDNYEVSVPFYRPDLRIKEDLIEEVGRVYGYDKIPALALTEPKKAPEVNKHFYYTDKIRRFLAGEGFSEVYTYTLRGCGDVELLNPLASDKAYLRDSLKEGLRESLNLNIRNAPLLGIDTVKIFEIGTVFGENGEREELGIGILSSSKSANAEVSAKCFRKIKQALGDFLDIPDLGEKEFEGVWLIDMEELIKKLPQPKRYETLGGLAYRAKGAKYRHISPYPFALRDVAVWTPSGTKPEDVLAIIKKSTGDLLVNHSLFDMFEKEERVSFAFHLILQSPEKTLKEEEIGDIMGKVALKLNKQSGWEAR